MDPTAEADHAPWKLQAEQHRAREFSARQRELAAEGRAEGARARAEGGRIRAEAARIRDEAARTRDDAARVRDDAARVRDQAARARDLANQAREQALGQRLLSAASLDHIGWQKLLELDRAISEQAYEAASRDREAAGLDREAANKDRDAAERDRTAADSDRAAADKDRVAAEKERQAADADRAAADSDREASERELLRAAEHISKSERLLAVGRFAAGVAHEINNPLAAMLATLSSLQRSVAKDEVSTDELAPLLDDVQLSADRIAHVLADMKTWLYGGDELPARQRVDLDHLIKESLRLTTAEVGAAAKVIVDQQPTPPIWGVAPRLGQVLTNLLLNAAHAISGPPEANEIRITTRAVDQAVLIEVRDTGPGIPPEVLPRIFDPFYTTREGTGGTGLGLAMCQRIVAQHGGELRVETHLGEGSTFCVELPTGSETVVSSKDGPEASAPARKARVLIIDDDVDFARAMTRLLAESCEVSVAVNGVEGLERLLAPEAHYDVVLCDLMMPVMNGMQMYRRLNEVAPDLAAKLVFVTGGATTEESGDFMASIPNVQLQKPFSMGRLLALIEEHTAPDSPPVGD
ncbi:MAG: ATP-binding protein [Deltaproteobacteria bacterium]|nr:ATP-binding protein [Deltaproteobacteria bacterium]